MTGQAHDENLIGDQVLQLFVEIHLLDGDGEVGAKLVCDVHASTGTLTNFCKIAIEAGWAGVSTNVIFVVVVVVEDPSVTARRQSPWSRFLLSRLDNCRRLA